MTSLEKIKYIKEKGFSLAFIAEKLKLNVRRVCRYLFFGFWLFTVFVAYIFVVYKLEEAFQN